MPRGSRRVEMTPAYLLHQRPYRDTSRILEMLTRDHGRLTLFARAVSGSKTGLAGILQAFQPIAVSYNGRGEAANLTRAELICDESAARLPSLAGSQMMPGFYLNELLLKLTVRHDAQPQLFELYHAAICGLRSGQALMPLLRTFEKRLLDALGYGIDLQTDVLSGEPVLSQRNYFFRPGLGPCAAPAAGEGTMRGASLLALAHERWSTPAELDDARQILRLAIEHALDGQELQTRVVARALQVRQQRGVSA